VNAGDCKDRGGDLVEPVAHVEIREGLAHLGVALAIRILQCVEEGGSDLGLAVEESGGEPDLGGPLEHDGRARCSHGGRAFVPVVRVADLRARAQHHGGIDAVGGIEHQLQADGTAG
jgi:hypothetical protein